MKKVNSKEFASAIMAKNTLVVFGAPWCGPCKAMEPVVESAFKDSSVNVVKVDIDESPDIAQKWRIRNVPTFMTFSHGNPLETIQGTMGATELKAFVSNSCQ